MNKNLLTIEDCLEIIAGLTLNYKIDVDKDDRTIVYSIARQVFKGNALTDRQQALMQVKLLAYKQQFTDLGFTNFEESLQNLRMPLRQIDRRKYVKIVDEADADNAKNYKGKWIKIRFPFSKKDIVKVDAIAHKYRKKYWHKKGSHEHYFRLSENAIFDVCEIFAKKDFEIDKQLLKYYDEIKVIQEKPAEYIAGYWNNEIKNMSKAGIEFIGDVNNRLHLLDRKRQYGLSYITCDTNDTLSSKIAHREDSDINIDPKEYSLDEVVDSIIELERFPILCLIDNKSEYDQLVQLHNAFKNVVKNSEQTVLFRTENATQKETSFNNYIHENKLNNWLDNDTKIVYINKYKLPKLLLKNSWKPQCVLSLSSVRMNTNLAVYCYEVCDLLIWHDEAPSMFSRFAKRV